MTLTSTPERRTHGKAGTERRIACAKIVAPRLSDYRGQLEPAYPDCFIALSDIPPKQMPENIRKLGAWWLLVDQDREGIESHLNLEESKDIYENSQKATLQSNPQEEWLLVNVLGHSAPTKPCADLPHGPQARHPLDELNCSRPFRGPTVY